MLRSVTEPLQTRLVWTWPQGATRKHSVIREPTHYIWSWNPHTSRACPALSERLCFAFCHNGALGSHLHRPSLVIIRTLLPPGLQWWADLLTSRKSRVTPFLWLQAEKSEVIRHVFMFMSASLLISSLIVINSSFCVLILHLSESTVQFIVCTHIFYTLNTSFCFL